MVFDVIPVPELNWPFSGKPSFTIKDGTYSRTEECDPFPCYAHPVDLVQFVCGKLQENFPLTGFTDIYLPAWEGPGRTNGWASQQHWYDGDLKGNFGGIIILNGKRIPPMPAMTRYLVSHEYGHIVQYWLEKTFNLTNLITAYAKDLRDYTSTTKYYGGRTWHATPGEIFANDFRIEGLGMEADFWPHFGFDRPEENPKVRAFWLLARNGNWDNALNLMPSLERKKDKS